MLSFVIRNCRQKIEIEDQKHHQIHKNAVMNLPEMMDTHQCHLQRSEFVHNVSSASPQSLILAYRVNDQKKDQSLVDFFKLPLHEGLRGSSYRVMQMNENSQRHRQPETDVCI